MRITKKTLAATAAGVSLIALALSGCATSASAPTKVKDLTIWASQSTPAAVKTILADYEKTSGVAINLVTIPDTFETNTLTKWEAGQRPDVIFYQPGPGQLSQLNPKKNLQSLDSLPFVKKTKYSLADSGKIDGVHYTATYDFPSVFGLYYNKKVFADNGIPVPKTTSELNADAAKLKAAGVTPFGISGGDSWTGQIGYIAGLTDRVAAGDVGKINKGAVKVSSDAFVSAAAIDPTSVKNGWVNPDYLTALYANIPTELQSGKIAMYAMASWMNASFTDTTNIGFVAYPSTSGAVQWQSSNNASVQLPKTGKSDREAAARDFVDYMTVGAGYKNLLAKTGNPSIIDGIPDPANVTALNKAAAAAFTGKSVASLDQQLLYAPADRATLLGQVLGGTLSPAEFGVQYQAEIEKLRQLQG